MADPIVAAPAVEGQPDVAAAPAVDSKAYLQFFPEDMRAEKTLEKFSGKDHAEVIGKLAKSYVNLEKHAGSSVKIPGENATPEERKAFHARLGVPGTPDEYGIDLKVPEGMPWDKGVEKQFLVASHGLGLTKGQTQGILDFYLAGMKSQHDAGLQARSATAEEAYNTIRGEWGGLTDRNLALVQRGVKEFGGEEFAAYLDESGLGNDPRFLKFALSTFQPMLEDNLIRGENLGMRADAAAAEIQELMKKPEYLKGDKTIIERIRELTSLAYGG